MNRFRDTASPDLSAVARTDVGLRLPLLRQEGRAFSSDQEPGRVVHSVFDFESIADATFLGSFAADARRPNLLVHCHTADIPALVPRMARSGGGSVRSCMVSGTLALPADCPATLILHDVARLSVRHFAASRLLFWYRRHYLRNNIIFACASDLRTFRFG